MAQHREHVWDGFTSEYNCFRVVWFEEFKYIGNAIAREKQIKRWRREKKVWLIEKENPTWEDLSAEWGKAGLSTPPSLRSGSGRDDNAEANAKAGPSTSLRFGRDDKVCLGGEVTE